ncbi:MAG: YgiT-type zinc finger protein [Deltaproteobacteria bacterium]|nr:YgiT-type zinc finger protein [Deltaproteobacteria bacterium]
MKCMYCKADLKRGEAPYHIDRNGYHLLLDRVCAWVCTQCGEPLFDEEQVIEIQAVIKEMDTHIKKISTAA